MAYTSCRNALAGNIAPDCANPGKEEFTGEGVIIDVTTTPATIERDQTNPRKITNLTPAQGTTPFAVDNVLRDPFSGSNTALNTEGGRDTYDNTLNMRVPNVDADKAKDVVEPLTTGRFIGVFPTTKGKCIVYGVDGVFRANAVTWNPAENDGDALVTMTSNEPYMRVECDLTLFNTLKGLTPA